MARKTVADAAKAKAAKQKKIVIALSAVLLLAVFYAYHTMSSLHGSGGARPQVAATATPSTAPTPASPSGSTAAPTLSGGATSAPAAPSPTSASAASSSTPLVAAVKPAAGSGQLQSFSHFESKDPFASQGPTTLGGTKTTGGKTTAGKTTGGTTTPTTSTSATPPASAVISVNGVPALVSVGSDFPSSTDPVENGIFHLAALSAETATISVVGGSYAGGDSTLTIKVNVPVTLVNTADGKQYTLQLYPQGTSAPASTAGSAATTTTTTGTTP
jgi:hypothetical protein